MAFAIILIWALVYNSYFGHNLFPKSDAEVICDGLTVIMMLIALTGGKEEG